MWDLVFKEKIPSSAFLIITFDDGQQIAGVFQEIDGRPSHALTSPQPPGLYMAQEYALDAQGNIYALVPNSKGVMIPSAEHVRSIRILNPGQAGTANAGQGNDEKLDPGRDQGRGIVDNLGATSDSSAAAAAAQPVVDQQAIRAASRSSARPEGLNAAAFGVLISLIALFLAGGPALRAYLRARNTKEPSE